MSDVKKRKREYKLRSKDKIATVEYSRELDQTYLGYMTLPTYTLYKDSGVCIEHLCGICGSVTNVKPKTMLTGRGCTVCKTNADHIHELRDFKEDLKRIHSDKFALCYTPERFTRDSGKYRTMFKCRDCNHQHYQTALTMLDPKFSCHVCNGEKSQGDATQFYKKRLETIYDGRISIVGFYHHTTEVHHKCDKYHTWLSSAADMLRGAGCSRCKSSATIKQIAPITYRNQIFLLRTKLEARALKAMHAKVGNHSQIRTSLNYPIPVLYGKKSPAFFHPKTKMFADVIKEEDFHKHIKKNLKSLERAKAMGYSYGVITVGKETASGIWTEDWLTGKRELPKKGFSNREISLGSGNVRTKVFGVTEADLPFDE